MTLIDLSTDSYKEIPQSTFPRSTVLALGNFDGVHVGHHALLKKTIELADEFSSCNAPVFPGVWLFRDPPTDFLRNPPPPHLSSLAEKLSLFRERGIRFAFLGDFQELGSYSPEEFAVQVLQQTCHCTHAVCGFNYSFGYKGAGTPELLKEYFRGAVSEIPSVEVNGSPVSSTRIRSLLTEGNVREATLLLGRPFSLTSPVLHGKALGRTISFPTINQEFSPRSVIPKHGIYAVTVHFPWEDSTSVRYGIANVGLRPTVETSDRVNCETFILDFHGDLYGKEIEIRFVERLRDERKMSGIDELRETIRNDELSARRLFGLAIP